MTYKLIGPPPPPPPLWYRSETFNPRVALGDRQTQEKEQFHMHRYCICEQDPALPDAKSIGWPALIDGEWVHESDSPH